MGAELQDGNILQGAVFCERVTADGSPMAQREPAGKSVGQDSDPVLPKAGPERNPDPRQKPGTTCARCGTQIGPRRKYCDDCRKAADAECKRRWGQEHRGRPAPKTTAAGKRAFDSRARAAARDADIRSTRVSTSSFARSPNHSAREMERETADGSPMAQREPAGKSVGQDSDPVLPKAGPDRNPDPRRKPDAPAVVTADETQVLAVALRHLADQVEQAGMVLRTARQVVNLLTV